jgi:uncharacterized protein (TIGR02145 family)
MKKLRNQFINSLLMGGLVFLTACIKTEPVIVVVPVMTTTDVTNLTQNTGKSGGIISSDGGSSVISRGVCWSTNPTPTIADRKTSDGTGTGTFTSTLTGLSADSTYYIRAYATNNIGTGYGNTVASLLTDLDGNIYHKVTIGTQTWMVENLKTTRYRTGEGITNNKSDKLWNTSTYGAWCDYNNDEANGLKYGKLYNWNAINDSRNIAPVGWHVATNADWTTLVTYLGGEGVAASKLKDIAGFTALMGGSRSSSGSFGGLADSGFWWTSTENNSSNVFFWTIVSTDVYQLYKTKLYGYSVRCVKD